VSAQILAPHFASFSVPVLKVRDFPGPLWDLLDVFSFYSCEVNDWIAAPKGFRTDGNSIPSRALSLVGYVADEPGYLHDWLYTSRKYPRVVADKILREMMIARGYDEALAEAFYLAVRMFGQSHWDLPNVPQPPSVAALLQVA
jgi:hypothetical protein